MRRPSQGAIEVRNAEEDREFDPERGGVAPARDPELPTNHGVIAMSLVQGVVIGLATYFGYPELSKRGIVPPTPAEVILMAAVVLGCVRLGFGLYQAAENEVEDNDEE